MGTSTAYSISTFVFPGKKPSPKTSAFLRKKFLNAIKFEKAILEKYQCAICTDDKTQINKLKFSYLKSKKVWLANILQANARLSIGQRYGASRCLKLANELGIKSLPPDENVTYYPKDKTGGGTRIIHQFGLRYRACQLIAKKMITPHIMERSWQYDLKDQRHAVLNIKSDMEKGFIHWQKRDIKNFFGSFNGKALPKVLPLYKRLAEETCVSCSLNAVINVPSSSTGDTLPTLPKGHMLRHRKLARRGLPQGAISSPSIAAYVSSLLDIEVPDGVRMYSYVDDYLVLGKSRKKAKRFARNLKAAIASLPGGDFHLRRKTPLITTENLVFLGYEFFLSDSGVTLQVPEVSVLDMQKKISKFEETVSVKQNASATNKPQESELEYEFGLIWKKLAGWCSYFELADNVDRHKQFLEDTIIDYAKMFNYSPSDIEKFSDKWVEARSGRYRPKSSS